MSERIEKVKTHLKENKATYFVGVGGVVVGTAVGFFSFGRGVQIVDSFKLINWKSPHTSQTILHPQGHLGYKVRDTVTGNLYCSQNSAARALGVNKGIMSGHLNGKFPDVNGHILERVGDYLDGK
jgi:hypothetical protein